VNRFEYTNVSVGPGFSGGPVFDRYGNVVGMHDVLTADEAHYAIAIKIDSALQTLQALDYAVPKAVPFSMPQFGPAGVPQSQAAPGGTTAHPSSTSDLELYRNARLSEDPTQMEAAAANISDPNLPTMLRAAAQKLRQRSETQTSASSDTEAYMNAMLLRDPDEIEAAAAQISNLTLAASLRTRAQMLRNASQAGSSAAAAASDSRRRLQLQRTKTEAKLFANRGNYMKALPLYQQLAEGGDSESMVSLGYFYYNGWGVGQDYAQAAKWFEKAAAEGETSVTGALGLMYALGMGVQRNDAIAVEWDRKAAAVGDATGMLGLGFMYENGRGVPKDMAMAVEWYRKSASLGNDGAKQNLRRLGVSQ
jgi:Sel1 repeat